MIYFISDTHFGHDNIIKYCGRPFKNSGEMNEAIINNWNKKVRYDDTVFHLGDFCLGAVDAFMGRLNGKIIPIKGNHDDRSWSCIESMIIQTHGEMFELCHDPANSRFKIVLCGHHHAGIHGPNGCFPKDRKNYCWQIECENSYDTPNSLPMQR